MANNGQNGSGISWGRLNEAANRVLDNGLSALERQAKRAAEEAANDLFGKKKRQLEPAPQPRREVRGNASDAPDRIASVFDDTEPDGTQSETPDLTDLEPDEILASQVFTPSPPDCTAEDCLAHAVAFYRLFCPVTEIDDDEDSTDESNSAELDDDGNPDDESDESDNEEEEDSEIPWIVAFNERTGEAFCGTEKDLGDHIQKMVHSLDDWLIHDDHLTILGMPCDMDAMREVLDLYQQNDMDEAITAYAAAHDGDLPPVLQHLHIDGVHAPLSFFCVIRGLQYSAKKEGKMNRYSHTHGERTKTFPSLYRMNKTTAILHNPAGLFDDDGKWLDD